MNIVKKYLEKRKQENERRKQEEFLNTRIPLNELFICELDCFYSENYIDYRTTKQEFKFDSKRILRKMENYYIDPTTDTKYRSKSYYGIKIGEMVVAYSSTINWDKEILERQYITIAELIELNEKLNSN